MRVDQDLQLYGQTKKIKASNTTSNATKENFDKMFEQGERELNVALKAEKITTDNASVKSKGIDSVDKNMDSEQEVKNHKAKFNPFDGLYHNENGTITDVDGQEVKQNLQLDASKNTKLSHHKKHKKQQLAQHKSKAKAKADDDEDNFAEGETRTQEVEGAKVQHQELEKQKAIIKEEEEKKALFKAEFNEFDGLRHKKDGTVQDPVDGSVVNGANSGIAYTQKNSTTAVKKEHHHHKKHHHKKHHHGHKKNATTAAEAKKPIAAVQVKNATKKHYSKKDDIMEE